MAEAVSREIGDSSFPDSVGRHIAPLLPTRGKEMDRLAGQNLSALTQAQVARTGGVWVAYNLMISDPKRGYIPEKVVEDMLSATNRLERAGSNFTPETPFRVADLGCGNATMTRPLLEALAARNLSSHFILVDRNPVALYNAWLDLQAIGQQYFENAPGVPKMFKLRGGYFKQAETDTRAGYTHPRLQRAGVAGHTQTVDFIQADITELPFQKVHAVTAINVWHHFTPEGQEGLSQEQRGNMTQAMTEIDRVLEEGGQFIFVDTAKLPDNPLAKKIRRVSIARAVTEKNILGKARTAGIQLSDLQIEGVQSFIGDAHKAFNQALSPSKLYEVICGSPLGKYSSAVEDLRSPKLPWKVLYPNMTHIAGFRE